jgi:hypothetical protein
MSVSFYFLCGETLALYLFFLSFSGVYIFIISFVFWEGSLSSFFHFLSWGLVELKLVSQIGIPVINHLRVPTCNLQGRGENAQYGTLLSRKKRTNKQVSINGQPGIDTVVITLIQKHTCRSWLANILFAKTNRSVWNALTMINCTVQCFTREAARLFIFVLCIHHLIHFQCPARFADIIHFEDKLPYRTCFRKAKFSALCSRL